MGSREKEEGRKKWGTQEKKKREEKYFGLFSS